MKYCLLLLFAALQAQTQAQPDSLPTRKLTFSGYAEIFYAWDFSTDKRSNFPPNQFLYNHNRHNAVSLNLAYAKAAYAANRLRANFALMAGTYAIDNLADEPAGWQYVYEANAGVQLGKNLWLDAGILPSHIGFESAVGMDCPTLTRSLAAEGSPYYEAGLRLAWANEHFRAAALYLNGWQQIARTSSAPAFGAQFTWTPNDRFTLNYSNFLRFNAFGLQNERRLFHNLYAQVAFDDHWQLWLGYDRGTTQRFAPMVPPTRDINWSNAVAILRWQSAGRWAFAARAEFFEDPDGAIIQVFNGTAQRYRPVSLAGYSLNADCRITPNALARFEGRFLHNDGEIFIPDKSRRFWVTASLAVAF